MRLIQLLSFPLKHTLVAYGCHKSPKLTISIYRPRCATAITQEDARIAHQAEKKRKAPMGGSSSQANQRFRLIQAGPPRASYQHRPVYRPVQYQTTYRPPP